MVTQLKDWPKQWTRVPGFEDFQDIIYEKKYFFNGGVARLSFSYEVKPGFTAWREETFTEFAKCLADANHDASIGVVVLATATTHFMTGGDMNWEATGGLSWEFEFGIDIHRCMRRCRSPIIAAVKGYCIAVGNHVAYFADFTIAADNAIFGQNGPNIGSPVGGSAVAYATRIVGAKKAREMWMLCRRYTADEAVQMGLANKVVPLDKLDDEVDQWCKELLDKCPPCIEILKQSFDADIDYMRSGDFQNLMYPEHYSNPMAMDAAQSFFERRTPDYGSYRGRPEGWS